jgi:hypothetical protein
MRWMMIALGVTVHYRGGGGDWRDPLSTELAESDRGTG